MRPFRITATQWDSDKVQIFQDIEALRYQYQLNLMYAGRLNNFIASKGLTREYVEYADNNPVRLEKRTNETSRV